MHGEFELLSPGKASSHSMALPSFGLLLFFLCALDGVRTSGHGIHWIPRPTLYQPRHLVTPYCSFFPRFINPLRGGMFRCFLLTLYYQSLAGKAPWGARQRIGHQPQWLVEGELISIGSIFVVVVGLFLAFWSFQLYVILSKPYPLNSSVLLVRSEAGFFWSPPPPRPSPLHQESQGCHLILIDSIFLSAFLLLCLVLLCILMCIFLISWWCGVFYMLVCKLVLIKNKNQTRSLRRRKLFSCDLQQWHSAN